MQRFADTVAAQRVTFEQAYAQTLLRAGDCRGGAGRSAADDGYFGIDVSALHLPLR